MGRKPDLPCDIEQVVDLLGIEVIRDTGTQLHCRCPFCADRKAHMNVKIRDNVFRCNRCGKGGGILHLYAEFCEVTLHTAYEELCKMFGPDSNEKPREYKKRRKIIETAELPIASAEVRDNTYSNLLSLLTLCPTHQASLKERGLTRDEIDWLGYRTTPTTRLRRIVTELLERGCVLDGVPGFYCQKDTGQWTLDIRGSGIMLPDRNLNGQIEAIQVRLDKVYNQKFYNLTSIDQYYGTQSKCCPHYVGVHEGDEVVCLTEGVMKADIAYSFALGTSYESGFVGLTVPYIASEIPDDPRDITPEQWEAMKAVDIRTVDKSQLVDLSTVHIDESLPVRERVLSYLKQVKNPYCVRVGNFAVKVKYKEDGPSFEEVFKHLLQQQSMM